MEIVLVLVGVLVGVAATHALHVLVQQRRPDPLDVVTGVPTRAVAEKALRDLRAGDAVVMLDVDGLKVTNDSLGHAAGDALLSSLADHLRHSVRANDIVARWGGDEFVLVLRAGGAAATEVVDRLRADAPTEFSAGVSLHRGGDGTATLHAADGALLRAKNAGGRSVVEA